jgi:hypothetical protein
MKIIKYTYIVTNEIYIIGTDLKLELSIMDNGNLSCDLLSDDYEIPLWGDNGEIDAVFFAFSNPTLTFIDHNDLIYPIITR